MIFNSLRDGWTADGNLFRWAVPEGWMQGRSLFGGLTVAAGAALASRDTDRTLRTVQAQLLGPVEAGTVEASVAVLREGKTTRFVEVRMSQDGTERAILALTFVAPRRESVVIAPPSAPDWGAFEDAPALPYIPGMTPEFTQHLEFRFAHGGMPFQGGDKARFGGFVRFRGDRGPYRAEHQLAFLDAWPCPTLSVLDQPAFASTVTWTAHLLAPSAPGPHQFSYETVAASGGFSTSVGHMWDARGTYVGYSEQTVVVFDQPRQERR